MASCPRQDRLMPWRDPGLVVQPCSGSGSDDNRHVRLAHKAPGHASERDAVPGRAQYDYARVELARDVEDGPGYVAFVGFTDQAARAYAGRVQAGHDLIDGMPSVRAAMLAHHRRQASDRELTDMQHYDKIPA